MEELHAEKGGFSLRTAGERLKYGQFTVFGPDRSKQCSGVF